MIGAIHVRIARKATNGFRGRGTSESTDSHLHASLFMGCALASSNHTSPQGEFGMLNNIEFIREWYAEVQDTGIPGRLRQVKFRKGALVRAVIRPVDDGTAKLADLCFADGTTAVRVPLSCVAIIEQESRAA